jgi:AraC-like DNA-binding protein
LKIWAARRSIRTRPADGRLLKGRALRLVAIEVGYSDQAHFSREFRRFYGVPPSAAIR